MKIKMIIPQQEVLDFLSKQGYEVKSWLWKYEDETFPNGVTSHESWTFTATKEDDDQCEKNIFTQVFEKEVQSILRNIST